MELCRFGIVGTFDRNTKVSDPFQKEIYSFVSIQLKSNNGRILFFLQVIG